MTTMISELGNKWLPLSFERFFTAQRADDMWFGDELPPTAQAEMRSPLVLQSKLMLRHQVLTQLANAERRQIAAAETARRRHATSRVGKRGKSSRH